MSRYRLASYLRLAASRRTEENRQHEGSPDCSHARNQEQRLKIHRPRRVAITNKQFWSETIRDKWAKPEDHQVKQSLSAGTRVLREKFVHENVNRCKKECVANAVKNVHRHDESLVLREKCEHGETRRVSQDADNHRRLPTESFERCAEHEHGENFRDLANTHHRHDPIAWNAHAALFDGSAEKTSGPVEKQIVHRRVNERDQPQNQNERNPEQQI